MSKLQVLDLIAIFLCPASLFADKIVLKNGDRLTGTIEKSDDKTLIIKTEFAGEVTVEWPAVQEITSTQALSVSLSDGKTVVGKVTTSDGNLAVARRPMRSHCTRACSRDGREGPTWGLP